MSRRDYTVRRRISSKEDEVWMSSDNDSTTPSSLSSSLFASTTTPSSAPPSSSHVVCSVPLRIRSIRVVPAGGGAQENPYQPHLQHSSHNSIRRPIFLLPTPLLLLILAVLLCVLLLLLDAGSPLLVSGWSIQYFYTVTPLNTTEAQYVWPIEWTLARVTTLSDDIGSDYVPLPFTFNYFRLSYRGLFITPNGALSLVTGDTPCCSSPPDVCSFIDESRGCTINNTVAFSQLIMPCMTDFDPSRTEESEIFYRISSERVDILYDQIPLYHQTPLESFVYTFIVTLHRSGTIEFHYQYMIDPLPANRNKPFDDLTPDPTDPKSIREWIVGLRGYTMSERDRALQQTLQGAQQTIDEESVMRTQYAAEMDQWNTSATGVYPDRSLVAKNTTITFCTMATDWCMSPRSGPEQTRTLLHFVSHDMTCASEQHHQYACRFQSISAPFAAASGGIGNSSSSPTSADLGPGSPNASKQPQTKRPHSTLDTTATYQIDGIARITCMTPTLDELVSAIPVSEGSTTYIVTLIDLTASNISPSILTLASLNFTYASSSSPSSTTPSSSNFTSAEIYSSICTHCAESTSSCWRDCAGDYLGTATYDACQQCSGGSTHRQPNENLGCNGRCFESTIPVLLASTNSGSLNHTLAQCFCDTIYESKTTNPVTIAITAEKFYHLASGNTPPHPVAAAISAPPSQLANSRMEVFEASRLAEPVPSLCVFETQLSSESTIRSPAIKYEIMLISLVIGLSLLLVVVPRLLDKRDRSHILPMNQPPLPPPHLDASIVLYAPVPVSVASSHARDGGALSASSAPPTPAAPLSRSPSASRVTAQGRSATLHSNGPAARTSIEMTRIPASTPPAAAAADPSIGTRSSPPSPFRTLPSRSLSSRTSQQQQKQHLHVTPAHPTSSNLNGTVPTDLVPQSSHSASSFVVSPSLSSPSPSSPVLISAVTSSAQQLKQSRKARRAHHLARREAAHGTHIHDYDEDEELHSHEVATSSPSGDHIVRRGGKAHSARRPNATNAETSNHSIHHHQQQQQHYHSHHQQRPPSTSPPGSRERGTTTSDHAVQSTDLIRSASVPHSFHSHKKANNATQPPEP